MTAQTIAQFPQIQEQKFNCFSEAPAGSISGGPQGVERRREKRYATCEPVDVCLLNMNEMHLSGTLRDISKSGLRIEVDVPVKAGDRMEVVLQGKAVIFAEVRYCRQTGGSYQVGSLIEEVFWALAEA